MAKTEEEYVKRAEKDLLLTIKRIVEKEKIKPEDAENLIDKARDFLKKYNKEIANANWNETRYTKINEIYRTDSIGKVVKLRVNVAFMRTPEHYLSDKGETLLTDLVLEDVYGKAIRTTNTTDEKLVIELKNACEEYSFIDILGVVVTVPIDEAGVRNEFKILILDWRPSNSIERLAELEEFDKKRMKEKLKDLKKQKKTVLEYIKDELKNDLKFELGDELLNLSIDAIIIQAFSDGWLKHANCPSRVHTLTIGSPGVGKKLLALSAWYVNPVYTEAHPTKVTAAGLSGACKRTKKGWVSDPGLLPEAHKGVFVLQDFHAVKTSNRNAALDTFSMVMEDGKVIDSTAAKTIHPSETAIHLDTNKITDLFPEKQVKGFTDDVNIPMNVLSRFDYICDIPRDVEKQIANSLERFEGGTAILKEEPKKGLDLKKREIGKLVAFLRSTHMEVTFSSKVRGYMREKFEEIRDANIDQLKDLPLLSDFIQRMQNSIHKFVSAYARMNDRSYATNEDVDASLPFLKEKMKVLMEVLANTQQLLKIPQAWEIPTGVALSQWISGRYGGQTVTIKQIREDYESKFGVPLAERTAYRRVKEVAVKIKKDKWKILK